MGERIAALEESTAGRPFAIYGAGFYGSYILSSLRDPSRVVAVIDQNPYLQGREHFGVPVMAPADLPAEVADVLVGLNPRTSRAAMTDVPGWESRALRLGYL
jgi:FlaA1/EpsC-like NDP-sugar epimerase